MNTRAAGPFTTRWYNDVVRDAPGQPTGSTSPVWSIAPESVIVSPAPNQAVTAGELFEIWGWAWADGGVGSVELSTEGGSSWANAALEPPGGRAWQRFSTTWRPERGQYELCSRAQTIGGCSQPPDRSAQCGASGYDRGRVTPCRSVRVKRSMVPATMTGQQLPVGTTFPITPLTPRPARHHIAEGIMMPSDLSRRAVMDIVVWLRSLGLEEYGVVFRENDIDETVVPNLTADDLKELGVSALGHRRKLLDAIAALRDDASSKAPSVDQRLHRGLQAHIPKIAPSAAK